MAMQLIRKVIEISFQVFVGDLPQYSRYKEAVYQITIKQCFDFETILSSISVKC